MLLSLHLVYLWSVHRHEYLFFVAVTEMYSTLLMITGVACIQILAHSMMN